MLNRCLFVARLADPSLRAELEGRLERLARFYLPLGPARLSSRWIDGLGLSVGAIDFDGDGHAIDRPLCFGSELPPPLSGSRDLIDADDSALRPLEGPLAAVAVDGDAACIVSAPGPTALFAAREGAVEAWSTHAVAARWLAAGSVELDPAALPVFVAAEFVGGDRSLVAGARAVPPATRVDVRAGETSVRSYWPAPARWSLVPERDAQGHGENALVASLAHRARDRGAVRCALTGGLDSRVAAAALRVAGVPFGAFTWGEPGWDDPVGAAAAARALGVAHWIQDPGWLGDDGVVARVLTEVRWSEGSRVELSHATLPAELDLLVTGGGGETGRAFYYRDAAGRYRRPTHAQMVDLMVQSLQGRLTLAGPAPPALRGAVETWVDEAEAAGLRGWRCLDHVYAEQRMRRWARQLTVRSRSGVAPAFVPQEVARALVSLRLDDRLTDGFHLSFLARHLPGFERSASTVGRPLLPGPVRRQAGRARRAIRGSGPEWTPPPPLEPKWEWRERPSLQGWVAEEVLTSGLLERGLGAEWLGELRRRFLAGDGRAEEIAQWAAGPVALEATLRDLD